MDVVFNIFNILTFDLKQNITKYIYILFSYYVVFSLNNFLDFYISVQMYETAKFRFVKRIIALPNNLLEYRFSKQ